MAKSSRSHSKSPMKKKHGKSKSPKKSKSSKRSPKRSIKRSIKHSPKRSPKRSPGSGEKIKFYDLLAKKAFYSSDYNMVTKTINGKNGKRKVTYYVTTNPTPRKDNTSFENWKIKSNEKA